MFNNRWLLLTAMPLLMIGGCGPSGMKISGQLTRGGQPIVAAPGERLNLSLISEKGLKFDFDTQPDGSFTGPTADDDRPFEPGVYTILLFHWKPGARGPDVASVDKGVTVEAGQTGGYRLDLPVTRRR
jgi:hypothetical protein